MTAGENSVRRRSIHTAVVVTALCLLGASCGNSTKDDSAKSPTTGSESKGRGGGENTRNDYVERPGVPGVTKSEIRYSIVGTKVGNPLGICILDCYTAGIKAYFAWRNSEGGIYGRKLAVGDIIDDELGQNQAKAQQVIADPNTFANFQATLVASGWGDLDKAGVPTYTWGINSTESANRTAIFPSLAVRCSDCVRPAVPWIAKQVGASKAAAIGYGISENSKECAGAFGDAITHYAKDSGVELAYTNDSLDYGLPNGVGPMVSAMKAAGVDFVASCIDLNGMKTLAQELRRQGMDDVVLYHPNSYDRAFVSTSDGLFDGDMVAVQFRPFEASATGNALTEFTTWIDKQGAEPSELAMVGWINASMAYDALLAAGPEFDRRRAIDALNEETADSAGGLLIPVDWTVAHTPYKKSDPQPSDTECQAFVKVTGNRFEMFGDPKKPWKCWAEGDPYVFDATDESFG